MASLNDGQHISQNDKVVRHVGKSIVMSTLSNDLKLTEKFELSYSDKIKHLEDSIKGISSRVAWLDASDLSTVDVENGRVTEWRDKTSNGIAADDSDLGAGNSPQLVSIDAGGVTRSALYFDSNDISLSLGSQLNDHVTGEGKNFTIVLAIKPNGLVGNADIVDIINKWNDSHSTFYIYMEDDDVLGTFTIEMYANDNLSNGIKVFGNEHLTNDKVYIATISYDESAGDDTDRVTKYLNRTDDKHSSSWSYGAGLNDSLGSNDDPLTIGKHSGSDFGGYRGSFTGHMYEIIIFNEVLSETNRALVEHYLGLKWNATKYMTDLRTGAE